VKIRSIKMKTLIFILGLSALLINSANGREVFAHYMIGFAYPSNQQFFEGQIRHAVAAGIDGFALNVGIDTWQPDRVAQFLAAAQNNGNFKLFLSFDMSSLTFSYDVLYRFHFAANHPNYYHYNGRPFFSTFAGEYQDAFWSNWKASSGLNPYFCPSWPNYPSQNFFQNHPVVDCAFTWDAWPQGGAGPLAHFDTVNDRNLLASARETQKQYMAPLAPWFYTYVWGPGWHKHWIYSSEILLPHRWQQLVELQPDFIQIVTWNDYSEASYVCEISSDVPLDMEGINDMINVPQPMRHDAWLELSTHYIHWYKNNARPIVTYDQFYWWYRVHPRDNVIGEVPQFHYDASDCVAVHSIVRSTTPQGGHYTVEVDLNGTVQRYQIFQLEQTECIPFAGHLGYVTISLIGPDNNVWFSNGNNIPLQNAGNNFNAFTNSHRFPSP